MNEEAIAYIEYLSKLKEIKRPAMPIFDVLAYTDNEYLMSIKETEKDFEYIDDYYLSLHHLKGE